ncbi:MAG: hypothetical protein IIC80_03320, partial [Chloroflexi bacterium]|nr:hypothetical protein [Chloroflexota bacterium]
MAAEQFDGENEKLKEFSSTIGALNAQLSEAVYSSYIDGFDAPESNISFEDSWEIVTRRSATWQAYARIAAWAVGLRQMQQFFAKRMTESKKESSWLHIGIDRASILDPLEECYIEFSPGDLGDDDFHERVCSQQFLRLALSYFMFVAGEGVEGMNLIREMIQVNVPNTSPYCELISYVSTSAISQLVTLGDSPDLEIGDLLELLQATQDQRFASEAESIVVDKIANGLEINSDSDGFDIAIDRWVSLIDSISKFKKNAFFTEILDDHPKLSSTYSSVRWAWIFGQISGRFLCSMTQSQSLVDVTSERVAESLLVRLGNLQESDEASD